MIATRAAHQRLTHPLPRGGTDLITTEVIQTASAALWRPFSLPPIGARRARLQPRTNWPNRRSRRSCRARVHATPHSQPLPAFAPCASVVDRSSTPRKNLYQTRPDTTQARESCAAGSPPTTLPKTTTQTLSLPHTSP